MYSVVETLRSRFMALRPLFDERTRCLLSATEARTIGRGGIPGGPGDGDVIRNRSCRSEGTGVGDGHHVDV